MIRDDQWTLVGSGSGPSGSYNVRAQQTEVVQLADRGLARQRPLSSIVAVTVRTMLSGMEAP